MTDEMIQFTINGQEVRVKKGTTVYQAAKEMGANIPIFCYQDRMPAFGACRVCLVEVDKMPKLQTSCTLVATEGMNVKTESAKAVDGRKGILELLLINHPLDCPICDRGGECPLQENALEHGPGVSEFFEEKRHFTKALPLGPVLMVDRERCIVCARCTRFGETIAGDHALQMIDRGFRTEIGTKDHQTPDSKFIGNTIEICPVGALTSEVYRFRARPWDNDVTPSSCTLCPIGCSLYFDSRDGEIMRTRACENRDVNDMWLCDKGYFGYEFTSSKERLTTPLIRKNGHLQPASYEEAFSLIATKLKEAKPAGKIAAFGGNPLTTEENYLFKKFFTDVLGVNHIDSAIGMNLGGMPGMEISFATCESLEWIALLGMDITEEFPLLWLRLRQAINRGAKSLFIGHYLPEIAPYLTKTAVHPPGKEREILEKQLSSFIESGKKGALFIGSQYLNTIHGSTLISFLSKFKNDNVSLNVMSGSGNSMGAHFAGMNKRNGLKAIDVLREAKQSGWDLLYVAGANPAVKFPGNLFHQAIANLKFLVVQDLFLTETALLADVVLPTLSYVEKGGSFINIEKRVQKLQPGKEVPENIYSDADIFKNLGEKFNVTLDIDANFKNALSQTYVMFENEESPPDERKDEVTTGLKCTFAKALFDHGVRMLQNPHLVKLVKKPNFRLNKRVADELKLIAGDQVTVKSSGGIVRGTIEIDDRVADETIVLPLGFREAAVHDLCDELYNGLPVTLIPEGNDGM